MERRSYCVDSDVLIWQLRNTPRRSTINAFLAGLAGSGVLACSVLSVAEVFQGMRQGEEEATKRLLDVLDAYPVDRAVAERAGELVRAARAEGRTLMLADALIAATCLLHGLVLVTLNQRDFSGIPDLLLEIAP